MGHTVHYRYIIAVRLSWSCNTYTMIHLFQFLLKSSRIIWLPWKEAGAGWGLCIWSSQDSSSEADSVLSPIWQIKQLPVLFVVKSHRCTECKTHVSVLPCTATAESCCLCPAPGSPCQCSCLQTHITFPITSHEVKGNYELMTFMTWMTKKLSKSRNDIKPAVWHSQTCPAKRERSRAGWAFSREMAIWIAVPGRGGTTRR